jgi:hypothetical protein
MSKQTAVDWLKEQYYESEGKLTRHDFDQAKQIEEEQIKNNYLKGCAKVFDVISNSRNGNPLDLIDADKYYNETYGDKI